MGSEYVGSEKSPIVPMCSPNIGSGQSRRSSTSTSNPPWAVARSMTHGDTRSAALVGRVLPMMICSLVNGFLLCSGEVTRSDLIGRNRAEPPRS